METMRRTLSGWWVAGALAFAIPMSVAPVEAQTARPRGATAQCKDGTYATAQSRRGACSGHGGVQKWLAETNERNSRASRAQSPPRTNSQPSQQPRPADATGQCQDGSYTTAQSRRGACAGNGGVQTWFDDSTTIIRRERSSPRPRGTTSETAPAPTAAPSTRRPTTTRSNVPENATARCRDGSYSFAKQHRGACSHHGGVAESYQ